MIGERLGECGAHVSSQRIVARHGLVRTLNDFDVFLASQHFHDCGLGEASYDVEMDGSDFYATVFLDMVDVRFDIFRCRSQ